MALTITTKWYKATVKHTDDGIDVTIWHRMARTDKSDIWKLNDRHTFHEPFHVVCDHVHDTLHKQAPPSFKVVLPASYHPPLITV